MFAVIITSEIIYKVKKEARTCKDCENKFTINFERANITAYNKTVIVDSFQAYFSKTRYGGSTLPEYEFIIHDLIFLKSVKSMQHASITFSPV